MPSRSGRSAAGDRAARMGRGEAAHLRRRAGSLAQPMSAPQPVGGRADRGTDPARGRGRVRPARRPHRARPRASGGLHAPWRRRVSPRAPRTPLDAAREPRVERTVRTCARQRGLTFIELVAVVAILMLVASAAMPIAKNAVRRGKEIQLRRALQTMRDAIDQYHKYAQGGAIKAWDPDWEFYPKDLDTLVE